MSRILYILFLLAIGLRVAATVGTDLHDDSKVVRNKDLAVKNFGLGVHVLFGDGTYSGSIGQHYDPTLIMVSGADAYYKSFRLAFEVASNQPKCIHSYQNGDLAISERADQDVISILIGYSLLDEEKYKFGPFVGFSRTEFGSYSKDNVHSMHIDNNFSFGANYEYYFKRKYKYAEESFFKINRYKKTTLECRLHIVRTNLYPDFEGYGIYFSAGLHWSAYRFIIQ